MKVFIIGLDGATLPLIKKWVSEGSLPNMSKLIGDGVLGHLKTVPNQNSAPAWTSLATGKNPGKHGIPYFYEIKKGTYSIRYLNGGDCKATAVWRYLSGAGKKVGVINVPMTYPAKEVNGFLISGMDAPGISSKGFTYPEDLKNDLMKAVPNYVIEPGITGYVRNNELDKAFLKALEAIDARTEAIKYLTLKYEWDFFMVVYREIDVIQHYFWKYMDKASHYYNEEGAVVYGEIIKKIYIKLDEEVGKLLKLMPEETIKIIVSDHGGASAEGGPPAFNRFLEVTGFLKYKKEDGSGFKRLIEKTLSIVQKRTKRSIKEKLIRYFPALREGVEGMVLFGGIDWSGTKVFADGSRIELLINMKGREPNGIVEKEDYDKVYEEVKRQLLRWRDPLTKKRIVKDVFKKEDKYKGDYVDKVPDLLVIFEDDIFVSGIGLADEETGEINIVEIFDIPENAVNGAHRDNGTVIMSGHGIKKGIELRGAEIIDIAPTVLYLMGMEMPDDMDGKVLWGAMDKSLKGKSGNKINISEAERDKDSVASYSEEDQEVMHERLKGLGYME